MEDENLDENIQDPDDHDVLSGRGNFVNYHPGNAFLRDLVRKYKLAYVQCPKPQKGQFSKLIYGEIRARNPPGRFLKQNERTNLWYDIGEKKALDKIRQALREGVPEIIKELSGDEMEPAEMRGSRSVSTDSAGNPCHPGRTASESPIRNSIDIMTNPYGSMMQGCPPGQMRSMADLHYGQAVSAPRATCSSYDNNNTTSQLRLLQLQQEQHQQLQQQRMNAGLMFQQGIQPPMFGHIGGESSSSHQLPQTISPPEMTHSSNVVSNRNGMENDTTQRMYSTSEQSQPMHLYQQHQRQRIQDIMLVRQQIEAQNRQIQSQQQALMAMMQNNQHPNGTSMQPQVSQQNFEARDRSDNQNEPMISHQYSTHMAGGLNVQRPFPEYNVPATSHGTVSRNQSQQPRQNHPDRIFPEHDCLPIASQHAVSMYPFTDNNRQIWNTQSVTTRGASSDHAGPLPSLQRPRSHDRRAGFERDNSEKSINVDNVFNSMPPPPSPNKQNVSSVGQLSNMSLSIGDIYEAIDGMGDLKSSTALRVGATPRGRTKESVRRSLEQSQSDHTDLSGLVMNISVMSIQGDEMSQLGYSDANMSLTKVFEDDK